MFKNCQRSRFIRVVRSEPLERRQLLSTSIALEGTTGNDSFLVSFNASSMQYDFSGGVTAPSSISATGFAGFNLVGSGGSDTLTIVGGSPTLLDNIGTDGSSFSVTVSAGTFGLNSTEDVSALSVSLGATVRMLGTGHPLTLSSLTFAGSSDAWQGQLDLGSNDLIVHGGDVSVLSNQIKSGFNRGTWSGTGINSSVAAGDPTRLAAIGISSNSDGSGNAI